MKNAFKILIENETPQFKDGILAFGMIALVSIYAILAVLAGVFN